MKEKKEIVDQVVRERVEKDLGTSFCVEAGAGTGKTTILVSRYLSIIERGLARCGEIVAIIGKNGSGKSTLMKLTVALIKPWKGKAYVMGKDVSTSTTRELVQYVGYVFQNPDHQLFTSSVEEELAFGPRNLGLPPEEVRKRVEEALEALELQEFRKSHPHALSRGQRRRLAVATVLTMHPKILILDEPTTGQDWGHSVKLMELAKKLNRVKGVTVIFITHDMRLVAEYATRVILMNDGKVIFDAGPREIFNNPKLLEYNILPPYITQLSHKLFTNRPPVLRVEEFIEGLKPRGLWKKLRK